MNAAILYMKSGNKVKIEGISNITISKHGNEIRELEVTWANTGESEGVLVGSIVLNQIEAIETV